MGSAPGTKRILRMDLCVPTNKLKKEHFIPKLREWLLLAIGRRGRCGEAKLKSVMVRLSESRFQKLVLRIAFSESHSENRVFRIAF